MKPAFPKAPKRVANLVERFLEKVRLDPRTGCWEWLGAVRKGRVDHGRFRTGKRTVYAHRIALAWHRGKTSDEQLPEGVARHKCDNSFCVNPAHLTMGSKAQNNRDIIRRGRHVPSHGLRNGNGKLSDDDVKSIRSEGLVSPKVAKRFRISVRYLRRIVARQCRAA